MKIAAKKPITPIENPNIIGDVEKKHKNAPKAIPKGYIVINIDLEYLSANQPARGAIAPKRNNPRVP